MQIYNSNLKKLMIWAEVSIIIIHNNTNYNIYNCLNKNNLFLHKFIKNNKQPAKLKDKVVKPQKQAILISTKELKVRNRFIIFLG